MPGFRKMIKETDFVSAPTEPAVWAHPLWDINKLSQSVLSFVSKGYVGSAAHGTLLLKMIHLIHALLHTQALSLLSPQTLLCRMIFCSCLDTLMISSFSVSPLSPGNRHHLFIPSSPAPILCYPALPNSQSPSLSSGIKVIDCAYASFLCGHI